MPRSDSASQPDSGGQGSMPSGDRAAAIRKVTAHCPSALTRSQCIALVKEMSEDSTSQAVSDPHDCLKIMSKDECEAMAAALQSAAKETAGSVGVPECLENPTPRCEAQLGPVLEAEYAASQEAGK